METNTASNTYQKDGFLRTLFVLLRNTPHVGYDDLFVIQRINGHAYA